MRPRSFHLTETEANYLQAAYLQEQDAHTRVRYQAVRLYGLGYPVEEVVDICGLSASRLFQITRAYREGGLPALVDHRQGGNRARLSPTQIETIQNQVHRYSPAQLLGKDACRGDGHHWTSADLAILLERDYQVVYDSPNSVLNLLRKIGFSYQRPSKQYKSHNEGKVMDFEEQLEKKS